MSIRYEKINLGEAKIERLRKRISEAERSKRFARYMAWRHYASLKRWRDLGIHHLYLQGDESFYCTCGLVLERKDQSTRPTLVEVSKPVTEMSEAEADAFVDEILAALLGEEVSIPGVKLDEVQSVIGHRNLPSGRGLTVAIIINCTFNESNNQRYWDGICQSCAASILQVCHKEASDFVKTHNRSCRKGKQ